jgi:hypothetical protein
MRHERQIPTILRPIVILSVLTTPTLAQPYDLTWHTIAGGSGTSANGPYRVSGTIGQPAAGTQMTGGDFALVGGFWPGAAPAGAPATTLVGAVSRKANAAGPGGFCDLPLGPGIKSDPRQGGVTELRMTFNVPPGAPGANPVTLEQASCAANSAA